VADTNDDPAAAPLQVQRATGFLKHEGHEEREEHEVEAGLKARLEPPSSFFVLSSSFGVQAALFSGLLETRRDQAVRLGLFLRMNGPDTFQESSDDW
jgi:hypothetical protein